MNRLLCENLRIIIAEYLNESIKIRLKYSHDQIPDAKLFCSSESIITGSPIIFHELSIVGNEFYVSKHHILLINSQGCVVYTYDSKMNVKIYKKIELSFLFYKRLLFHHKERLLLYKIYLNLIEKKIYRYEAWFEAIMTYLDINNLDYYTEFANGLIIAYRNGREQAYDEYFNLIEKHLLKPKTNKLGDELHKYVVNKSYLKIYNEGSNYISKRKIGRIKQYMVVNNTIFILTTKNMITAKFTE